VLHFPCGNSRELNEHNIERLKRLFREQGCRRLEIRNHIPAIIDKELLYAATQTTGIIPKTLLTKPTNNYLELEFLPRCRLEYLYSRYRLRVGAEVLPLGDRRWTVDLYLVGMISLYISRKALIIL
jgi:hypothetical protein